MPGPAQCTDGGWEVPLEALICLCHYCGYAHDSDIAWLCKVLRVSIVKSTWKQVERDSSLVHDEGTCSQKDNECDMDAGPIVNPPIQEKQEDKQDEIEMANVPMQGILETGSSEVHAEEITAVIPSKTKKEIEMVTAIVQEDVTATESIEVQANIRPQEQMVPKECSKKDPKVREDLWLQLCRMVTRSQMHLLENTLFAEETMFNVHEEQNVAIEMESSLNSGFGKTYVYNALLSRVRGEGKIALTCASSGIAALLLSNGRTAHSRFKIPIDVHNTSTCNIKVNSTLAELLRQTSLIVWDEAPMEQAILAPRNKDVNVINSLALGKLDGASKEYQSAHPITSLDNQAQQLYTLEFLNTLDLGGGFPLRVLILKENAPIILLRNLDPRQGLCNGTRLICKQLYERVIEAKIITGKNAKDIVLIPRIDFNSPSSLGLPFKMKRRQFPISLLLA
ncbi:hypothetical protein L7F22_009557 [Adiantum nelumboides]|nr:hypothetical protein [Adiantum nelumboides]